MRSKRTYARALVSNMKLFAEITDEDLLFKLLHELGCTFYRLVGNGETEVVYFSGSKIVHFKGKLQEKNGNVLKATAWEVKRLEVDALEGKVTIEQ